MKSTFFRHNLKQVAKNRSTSSLAKKLEENPIDMDLHVSGFAFLPIHVTSNVMLYKDRRQQLVARITAENDRLLQDKDGGLCLSVVSSCDVNTIYCAAYGDGLRLTSSLLRHPGINSFMQIVRQKVDAAFPQHEIVDATFLLSLAGCQRQVAHRDINPQTEQFQNHVRNEGALPSSCVVAVQHGSTMCVWPGSHLDPDFLPAEKDMVRISIPKHHMLVFRADLVHSGSDYDADNLRIHFFLDPKVGSWVRERDVVGWVDAGDDM